MIIICLGARLLITDLRVEHLYLSTRQPTPYFVLYFFNNTILNLIVLENLRNYHFSVDIILFIIISSTCVYIQSK